MHRLLIALPIALAVATTADAAIYQWRDKQGVTHFTDNPDSIPQRYLNVARELPSIRVKKKEATKPSANAPATQPSQPSQASQASQAGQTAAKPEAKTPAAASADRKETKNDEQAKLAQELKALQDALPNKKEELAKLRHKWVVRKGRTPAPGELKELEKKRLKKKVVSDDVKGNPFVNRNSLTVAAPARMAYFQKLEEIQKDEERIRQLEGLLQP